jgi:hypothetical protein
VEIIFNKRSEYFISASLGRMFVKESRHLIYIGSDRALEVAEQRSRNPCS